MHSAERTKTGRNYWYDNAKAILILMVVLGHLAEDLLKYADFAVTPRWLVVLYKSIYLIHMPAFMIISGRFAKRRIDNNDWVPVIEKMVIPYIVLQTVQILVRCILDYGSTSKLDFFAPNFGLWYLITLAFYQLITPHLKKVRGLFWFAMLAAVAVAFAKESLYGGFHRVVTYYPFFLFGYYLAGYSFEICKKWWFRVVSVLSLALMVFLVTNHVSDIHINMLALNQAFTTYKDGLDVSRGVFLIMLLIRYVAGFLCFFIVLGLAPVAKHFFTYVGTHSTYVYLLHLFVIMFFRALDKHYDFLNQFGTNAGAIFYCMLSIPIVFFLASPWIRKVTSWLVSPDVSLKRIITKIDRE